MLTLVYIVYEAEAEIPETLAEFFEKLFYIVFTRHDRLKGGFSRKVQSNLSEAKLQKLFEGFCFSTINKGYNRTINLTQFEEIFESMIKYSTIQCDQNDFKKRYHWHIMSSY